MAALFLWSSPSAAMNVVHADVQHDAGHYTVAFEVVVNADSKTVRKLMTDYPNLPQLSQTVVASRVLSGQGRQLRLELMLRDCVSVFCKTLRNVKDVKTLAGGDVVTRVVPELSDFRYAFEHWQLLAEDQRTRIKYHSKLALNFFVPPLIGPPLIKSRLRAQLEDAAVRLEVLAGS